MDQLINLKSVVSSLVFAVIGFVVFIIGFYAFDKFTPYNLWHELTKQKNVALAIVVASVSLGTAIIIAAAIHG